MTEQSPYSIPPFNPLNPVVIILTLMIVGTEATLQLADRGIIGGINSVSWRNYLLINFAFHDAVFEHILQNRQLEPAVIWPFFTYPFIHLSIGHVAIGVTLFLAMGKTISEKFSGLAVLILFIVCSLVGAIVFGLVTEPGFPLVGAYPAVYGFIAAYTWIEYARLKKAGESVIPAFRLIVMLLIFRTVFALFMGARGSWPADFSGLITGFLLSFILAPDGRDRIRGWLALARRR
ncbi:MAG: rhomboid family intramembrane serine protease [Rhodobacteraceae bacterium]|nr:rhomboid family intramembrane serine protease [Paracoccaceae bacterium]